MSIMQKRWAWPAVAAAALLVGTGIGSATQPEPTTQTVTQTKVRTVPGPTKTVVKTDVQEKTPASCLTALDYADQGFGYASESMGYAQEGFEAVSNLDIDKLQQVTPKLQRVNEKIGSLAPKYRAAKDACRSAR